MKITLRQTQNGFLHGEFEDRYRQRCSIQESSAADPCLWLGVDNTGPLLAGPGGEKEEHILARMHLTQEMVRDLLPLLQHFVEHGDLPRENNEETT